MFLNNVKIFVSRRIDLDSFELNSNLYCQVECGSIYRKKKVGSNQILKDCDGINISEKRQSLGELTVQYWAWKNFNLDYYGLCHYRRFLAFSKCNFNKNCQNQIIEKVLNDDSIKKYNLLDVECVQKLTSKFKIIVNEAAEVSKIPTPEGFTINVYDHWVAHRQVLLRKESLDSLIESIRLYKPEYYASTISYLRGNKHRGYNCFILEKGIFDELCEFQFGILFDLETKLEKEGLLDGYPRTLGYLGEIMYGIFIHHKNKNDQVLIKELPLIYFQFTEKLPKKGVRSFLINMLLSLKIEKETVGFKLFPKDSFRRNVLKKIYFSLLTSLKR